MILATRPQADAGEEPHRTALRGHTELPDYDPPAALDYTMTGKLADDRSSAKGTLIALAVFGRGHASTYCHGRVRFTASARS